MHILGGLLLLVVVFGVFFFISQSNLVDSLGLQDVFRGVGGTSSSTSSNSHNYQEVRIQFVSLGNGSSEPMVVSLRGNPAGDGVNVSGWSLRTNIGTYAIPRAVNLYSASVEGLPPEDIYIRHDGNVNIYSGSNPRGGPSAVRSGEGEWQIWLDKNFLSSPHGTIILRDGQRKTVDEYRY
jgi:hypothetical protein